MRLKNARLFRLLDTIYNLRKVVSLSGDRILSQSQFETVKVALKPYCDLTIIEAFIEDCREAKYTQANFTRTRNAIYTSSQPFIIGFFSAPYNQELGLEMGILELLDIPEPVKQQYPFSKAVTVNLLASTYGFQEPACVALFPENFVGDSGIDQSQVFYFINKFVRRFSVYTLPVLNACTEKHSFWRVKRANENVIEQSMCTWLYLHENFHNVGPLPLPYGLSMKSTRNTAALEESKVDMQSVLACIEIAESGFELGMVFAEMILAERLFRYPVSYDPSDNYDARGTQILFKFLGERNAFDLDSTGILKLRRPEIVKQIDCFVQQIWTMESRLASAVDSCDIVSIESAKMGIQEFVKCHDSVVKTNSKGLSPFFEHVRNRLATATI
jgi:hypothetical protein